MPSSNPLDAAISAATPAPAPAPSPAPATGNVLDMAIHHATTRLPIGPSSGVKSAQGEQAAPIGGGVLELLSRPNEALLATQRGLGAGLQTLLHSESQSQYTGDTDRLMQTATDLYNQGQSPEYRMQSVAQAKAAHPFENMIAEILTQTGTDPTIFAGKLGLGKKLLETLEAKGLPTALKGANTAAQFLIKRAGAKQGAEAAQQVEQILTNVGRGGKALYSAFGVDSPQKMALAKEFGEQWLPLYQKASSLRGGAENFRELVSRAFKTEFKSALEGLNDKEQLYILKAVNSKRPLTYLPKAYQPYAQHVRDIFDAMHYLGGNKAVQEEMVKKFGYKLPGWAQHLYQGAIGIRKAKDFEPHYYPAFREADPISDAAPDVTRNQYTRRGGTATYNPVVQAKRNPHLQPRSSVITPRINDLEDALHRAQSSFEFFGKEMQGQLIKRRLRDIFGEAMQGRRGAPILTGPGTAKAAAKIAKLGRTGRAKWTDIPSAIRGSPERGAGGMFAREFIPENKQTDWQAAGGALKRFQDLRKAAMFITPYPHMANITALLGMASPTAVPKAIALYMKLKKMTPEQQIAELRDAIDAGAISLQNVERQSPFIDIVGKGGKVGKGLAKVYKSSGERLWSFDDAAKATLFREMTGKGISKEKAAYEVGALLVDYAHRSPAAEAMRHAMPFATWRSKMPVAVARGIISHPERYVTAGRVAPALTGGTQSIGPDGKPVVKNYGPLAEFSRLLSQGGIADYGRASFGPEMKTLLGLLGAGKSGYKGQNYYTYGTNPWLYGAEAELPGVSELMDLLGIGAVSGKDFSKRTLTQKLLEPLKQLLEQGTRTYEQH